jgi:hypothetical protein
VNDAWYYRYGPQQFGPIPLAELRRLVQARQLGPNAEACQQGAQMWIPVHHAVALPVQTDNGLQYIVPTSSTSVMCLIAGYAGIFAFFAFPLAPIALIVGILGLRDLKAHPEKNGKGRAITGIVIGALGTIVIVFVVAAMLLSPKH